MITLRRYCCSGLLTLCSLPLVTLASDIQNAEVSHDNGRYRLSITMHIDSPVTAVRELMQDFSRLHELSDVIQESRLLSPPEQMPVRRRVVTETCVWFFCFDSVMEELVTQISPDRIETDIDPAQSDYRYGKTIWQTRAVNEQQTLIRFQCDIEPDFWIPPLIGPWLIKQKMQAEAEATILAVERLTQQHPPRAH